MSAISMWRGLCTVACSTASAESANSNNRYILGHIFVTLGHRLYSHLSWARGKTTILSFAAMSVGMSTEVGAVLGPHQVAIDKQELRRLYHLTGTMIGGTTPSGVVAVESVPYPLPEVSREEKKCPVFHEVFQTSHHMRCHMDIHKGTGYPCSKCHKSLASRKMLGQHE